MVLISISTNALVASILYSMPNGGAHPPRVYEIYPPSRTIIMSITEIINEITDEIKAKGHANLRLPNKTITGAVQNGTKTCSKGK
jgi:hypothetical protein